MWFCTQLSVTTTFFWLLGCAITITTLGVVVKAADDDSPMMVVQDATSYTPFPIVVGPTPELPTASTMNFEVLQKYPLPNPEDIAISGGIGEDPPKFFLTGTNDGYVLQVDIESGDVTEFLTPKDFNPNYWGLNTTEEEVRVACPIGSSSLRVCGRVLGIEYVYSDDEQDTSCQLLIVNSPFGVYRMDCPPATDEDDEDDAAEDDIEDENDGVVEVSRSGGVTETLEQLVGGSHHRSNVGDEGEEDLLFLNYAVYVAGNTPDSGSIYYTMTHSTFTLEQGLFALLDASDPPNGSVHRYYLKTGITETILDGLYFPNGLAISHPSVLSNRKLYIAETMAYRILQLDLGSGEVSVLIEDLPVNPDNLDISQVDKNILLVPGSGNRHVDADRLVANHTALAEFTSSNTVPDIISTFQSWIRPGGIILKVDLITGKIIDTIFSSPSTDGDDGFLFPTSVVTLLTKGRGGGATDDENDEGDNSDNDDNDGDDDGEVYDEQYIVGSNGVPMAVRIRVFSNSTTSGDNSNGTMSSIEDKDSDDGSASRLNNVWFLLVDCYFGYDLA